MRKKLFTFLLALATSVGMSWAASNGKLSGAFSVSASQVVYFSQGNLQATTSDQGTTWTWGFAENQWDYVGNAAANTSFDYWDGTGNGSYDLFGWIGASSTLTDYRQYGIGSNYDFTDCGNTAGENLKADWGSLMGSDWRTLTYDEWQYLIKSRNNAANLLAYATVNGKTGLILLPDSWTSSSVALTITTANYTTNIISASDWSTLEEQGCVFLPAAGWRSDDSVSGVGAGGDYWSSSSPSGKQYDEGSAYCFFFDTDFSKQADGMHFNKRGRGYGLSVRLVSETAPGGGSDPAVDPAVQNVIDLIDAIPDPVVYNQECFNALNAVFDAYVALSEEQRDQVTNYDDYLAAEARYYMLASVNYVIEKINEIGDVEFTSACKHKIDYARSEYCNLTLEEKGYVTNYNTLLAAEAAYAALIPVSSTVEWDEAILETIDVDEWGEETYTNGSLSLKAVDGRAYYVDDEQHFLFDGSNSEKSFVFSCTSANMLCIEITVSEKHQHNQLSCAWQETATGYRWVGEATSVDLASGISKVTGIRFSLGEAFPEPTPTPAQDGDKLPGAFSVSGEKVVYFSKGNLQYLGNIDRWHFAANQWTIIGNSQASNNRDLFSWGTGDNPDSEDYSTYTEWGNNIEGNWRTLTVDEWTYLFNTRTDASSKYGTATVAGVVGLILLPDNYDGTAINTGRTAWDNNVISSSAWAAYEAAGAVFLPAAGLSDAFGVYGVGVQGFYWSSTMDALSHDAISVFYGFDAFEGYWFNQVDAQFQPQEGHSVRLVSETAPTPASTAVEIGDLNSASEVETFLTTYDGQTIDELIIDRPVYNNMYNTLCLPFNMDATQIAASSLNGVIIREFTGASVSVVDQTLELAVSAPVNAVVAGRPYFVQYSAASQLDDLHFEGVTINNAILDNMAVTFDGVTFKGTFTPFVMPNGLDFQGGYLFLGQNNQLFWPNTSNPLKPFRAYFYVDVESSTPGNAPKYRGMPARIVEGKNVATGVESIQQSAVSSQKFIENGQLIIIKNGVRYNAQGQKVK